jgi:hypothetical protein
LDGEGDVVGGRGAAGAGLAVEDGMAGGEAVVASLRKSSTARMITSATPTARPNLASLGISRASGEEGRGESSLERGFQLILIIPSEGGNCQRHFAENGENAEAEARIDRREKRAGGVVTSAIKATGAPTGADGTARLATSPR